MEVRPAQGPIQSAFGGLLGFLGIKGAAVTPHSIAGYVQPVMDVTAFLANRPTRTVYATQLLNADAATPFQVMSTASPGDNETWLVLQAVARCPIAAVHRIAQLGVAKNKVGSLSTEFVAELTDYFSGPVLGAVASAAGTYVVARTAKPFFLLPGEQLGASIGGFFHGGTDTTLELRYEVLRLPL